MKTLVCSSLVLAFLQLVWRVPARASEPEPAINAGSTASSAEEEGTAVLSLVGEMGILDPDATYHDRDFAAGFSFQIVARRKSWPLMVGLGGGLLSFGSTSEPGPVVGYTDMDGVFWIGRTTATRSVELRHAELIARVQPFWGMVRPFIEAQVGLAAVWYSANLESARGDTVSSQDEQRSVGLLYGATLGIDWRLWRSVPGEEGTRDFVFTTGVKRLYTTGMERPRYAADASDALNEQSPRVPLATWVPFVGVALMIDNRASARSGPPPLPTE